jgi:hypothetical protein
VPLIANRTKKIVASQWPSLDELPAQPDLLTHNGSMHRVHLTADHGLVA